MKAVIQSSGGDWVTHGDRTAVSLNIRGGTIHDKSLVRLFYYRPAKQDPVYSASDIARLQFPDYQVEERSC